MDLKWTLPEPRWKPTAAVLVDGVDVTEVLTPRLSSITITDEAELKSDMVELVVVDHVQALPVSIPPIGAELQVSLGYGTSSRLMGTYAVDGVTISGPPGSMRVTGHAATFGGSSSRGALSTQRSRSWPAGTTLGAMAAKIAADTGFSAAVSDAAAAIGLGHIDQINESDMSLLTRLARDYGLRFKPGGGAIVLVQAGEGASASGASLPTIPVQPSDVSSWSVSFEQKEVTKTVTAQYRDVATAATVDVSVPARRVASSSATSFAEAAQIGDSIVGSAAEDRRLRPTYGSRDAAVAAANAEVKRQTRRVRLLEITMPGRSDIMAEAKLVTVGFRPGVNGEWLITRVRHSWTQAGWSTSVSAEAGLDP